ncbi:tetratricopeptide repeat protein [Opitutales bacterium]|nr:tetratricopeptide repeat protein [Opitutales bacterium]
MNHRSTALWLLLTFVLLYSKIFGESGDRAFYDAVRAEASGDLQLARSIYEELAKNQHSANLHANLANLYFKLEDYGRSILHFRKSLLLNPENRESISNLSFAMEMSGVKKAESLKTNPAFSATAQFIWASCFTILLWGGFLLIALLVPRRLNSTTLTGYTLLWAGTLSFLAWGWQESREQFNFLRREVISVAIKSDGKNAPVPLRRFAGKGSNYNTMVNPGTSLFLDLDRSGNPRMHQGPDGEKWFLARSKDGANKGWITELEFGKIIEL